MKIFGLTLVKNEADIIRQSMRDALQWCDRIGVIDNGSTDETYEILEDLAASCPETFELCGVHDVPFNNDLRRIPFNALRDEADDGDWWCRLDADEFYPTNPRTFLGKLDPYEYVVWSIHIQYYYTDRDYEKWQRGDEGLEDRDRPIQDRRRFYRTDSSEARFVKHRKGLTWDENCAWPYHIGPVAEQRIPVQHFRFRDPVQMKKRFSVRREAYDEGHHRWGDRDAEAWKEYIVDTEKLHYDDHDGDFIVDEELMPDHRESWPRRAVKEVCHRLGIWP